ncbi:hypothetical protein LTR37_008457 [Vermiconidia calcicola]|uniref:Uncharacterized protein n=1 Tax=Vermiconidia calcicola TaxID=1690605 RepID=A0ACC3NB81_9PEZI|nr:hypothetical protein LTR37_008457 [Vermiconidia calcicola]
MDSTTIIAIAAILVSAILAGILGFIHIYCRVSTWHKENPQHTSSKVSHGKRSSIETDVDCEAAWSENSPALPNNNIDEYRKSSYEDRIVEEQFRALEKRQQRRGTEVERGTTAANRSGDTGGAPAKQVAQE